MFDANYWRSFVSIKSFKDAIKTERGTYKVGGRYYNEQQYQAGLRREQEAEAKSKGKSPAPAAKNGEKKPAAAKSRPSLDETKKHIENMKADKNPASRLAELADILKGHTIAELSELKGHLGLKASGNKEALASKTLSVGAVKV
jgi:hypothetical protein